MINVDEGIHQKIHDSPIKSRRYTKLLTGAFLLIFIVVAFVLAMPIAGNIENVDASKIMAIRQGIYANEQHLLAWRFLAYFVLLISFVIFESRLKKTSLRSNESAKFNFIRVGSYMIIFELFIVQNSLSKAFSLIQNW